MFEPVDEKWWASNSWWSPRGNEKTPKEAYRRTVPLEADRSVESISDSTVRFVAEPAGMSLQLLSSEPLGHSSIALHQNHYAAPMTPCTSLGSIDFYSRDDHAASISSYVDQVWTGNSHPAGLTFRTTEPGSVTPRYPAMTIRADGRVAVGGGPTALGSSLVSMGVYRRGIFELPSVERYDDLIAGPSSRMTVGGSTTPLEPFVNGAIVYAKDLDRVLISQGGSWHAILTTPVSSIIAKPPSWRQVGPVPLRQVGEPRKDGLPTVFGPRSRP